MAQAQEQKSNLAYADPTIGGVGLILEPTRPTVHLPNSMAGQFVMGNEPSFHIPYIYNYVSTPWKTQKRIRMLMDTWYTDNLFDICAQQAMGSR